MKKKILCCLALIIIIAYYNIPHHALVYGDSLISHHALTQAQQVATYAFKHYSDLNTIDHYLKKQVPWIKKATYAYVTFKQCQLHLTSHTPLFLLVNQWIVAKNDQLYEASSYNRDTLNSLIPVMSTAEVHSLPYSLLAQLPANIIEQYTIALHPHMIIAHSKQYPGLQLIAASAAHFDNTLDVVKNALMQDPRFNRALAHNKAIIVDTRFRNQYVVRYQS